MTSLQCRLNSIDVWWSELIDWIVNCEFINRLSILMKLWTSDWWYNIINETIVLWIKNIQYTNESNYGYNWKKNVYRPLTRQWIRVITVGVQAFFCVWPTTTNSSFSRVYLRWNIIMLNEVFETSMLLNQTKSTTRCLSNLIVFKIRSLKTTIYHHHLFVTYFNCS